MRPGPLGMCGFVCALCSLAAAAAGGGEPEDDVFKLGEVVVTGEREAASLATTVTEISGAEIRASGARTVAEVLDRLPGIDVQVGSKREFHLKLRGFDQSDVKVLIDGVPAHETYFRTLDLSMLPVEAISKITVTKGASSVLYGPNTMGGVVNIVTRKGTSTPRTRVDVSGGDHGTRNVSLSHGAAAGDLNWFVGLSRRTSDGFRLSHDFDGDNPLTGRDSPWAEDGGRRKLSGSRSLGLHAKVGFDPDPDTAISLSVDWHDNERGIPPENDRYWAFTRWNQWHLNLVGERRFSDLLTLKARLFYVDHEDALRDVGRGNHQTARKWFEVSRYDDGSAGGELQATFDFGDVSRVQVGFSFIRDHNEQDEFLDEDCLGVIRGWNEPGWQPGQTYEADTFSLGVEDEIRFSDEWSVILGVSRDFHDPREAADQPAPGNSATVNPQAGVVFRPAEATTLHASVGRKTRFPHLKELYSEHAGGNPDLDPQVTVAFEAGVSHRFTDSLEVSLVAFHNRVRDLILLVDHEGEDAYRNIGRARIRGAETSVSFEATENLAFSLDYTYLGTRDLDNRRELEGRPRHRANAAAEWHLPLGLDARLQASYTRRQVEYDSDERARRIPSFLVVDARLAWRLPGQRVAGGVEPVPEVYFQVTNLFDKDYEEGHPMPGRTFLVGLAVEF